ncbi:MAG: pre-peptidase C-terminal domain-containing protein [Anaerolineae bacterium]|nr:pre-peptidase C-terminal domain-containing protein [Anaerolineae bacterium]
MKVIIALLWLALFQSEPTQIVTLTGYAGPVDLGYHLDEPSILTVTAHSLSAEPVDVTLEILLNEHRIAFNDDYMGENTDLLPLDAAIESLPLEQPGDYTIRIHSFNGAQDGDIAVSITTQPLVGPCTVPAQAIDLHANRSFACTVSLTAGELVTLTAHTATDRLDPMLTLLDADGQQVAANDDHEEDDPALNPLDAQIAGWKVLADGTYTIEVHDFAGQAGSVSLKLDISS